MSDNLRLLIGTRGAIARLREREPSCRAFVRAADAELAVIPVSLGVWENFETWYGTACDDNKVEILTHDLRIAEEASAGGALAYVEVDYYGSSGYEAAALWIGGLHVFGPDTLWIGETIDLRPINRALRGLGVTAADHGEYSASGLAALRENADFADRWIEI